jgi:hypothetical protein
MFSWYAFQFCLKPFVTILVAPVITGTILHFKFHIHCISVYKLLYFSFFSTSFAQHSCLQVLPHLSVCMFSIFFCMYVCFFFFNCYIWPIYCNFAVCVYCLVSQHGNILLVTLVGVCRCIICLSFQCLGLCMLRNANVHKHYCVSLNIHLSKN